MKAALHRTTYLPLHIPLPLLSLESSLNIFEKKNAKFSPLIRTNHQIRQLIADVGGHCRPLEMLYNCFLKRYDADTSLIDWNALTNDVREVLHQRYRISTTPLGAAIALSGLCIPVKLKDRYPDHADLNFQDLEEKGLVKLESENRYWESAPVRMSYFFITCHISKSRQKNAFWMDLLIRNGDFWWQDWKLFNRNYIAFRLSLYAYLGYTSLSLTKFFAGAKMNISSDIQIKIPKFKDLKISKINYRYPTTKAPTFEIGNSVLNGIGAPFDSFLFLETTTGSSLLLAFQMKLANDDSTNPQDIINREYTKIKKATSKLSGTEVVSIILGQGDGKFDATKLPKNCVVITKNEQSEFYGKSFHNRLLAIDDY